MKKCILPFAAVMLALSLTACTPTSEKSAAEATASSETVKADTMEERNKGNENLPVYASMVVYYINDDGTGLIQKLESVDKEEMDAQDVIDLMIEYDILEEGTEVLDFDEGTEGIGTLNLNQITDEEDDFRICLIVQSIVNGFTENYELDGLILQENGEVYTIDSIESDEDGTMYYESGYRDMSS